MSASFALIVSSALFHALWNVYVKEAREKLSYTVHIHIASSVFMTIVMIIFFPEDLRFDGSTILFALISAFFFSFYQVFVAAAYKYADVSMIYPVTTSSPLFIIAWAYFFLGERISYLGFAGILLILAGCYIMNLTRGKDRYAVRGLLFAFAAALFYSFGAMADKLGVTSVNTMLYIYLMIVFMTFYTAFFVGAAHFRAPFAKVEWKLVAAGGIALTASSLCYRLGLIDMQISYASALRQVSSLFGLLMGLLFFKESYGFKRAVGCVVIISGVVLIRLGI